MPTKPPAQPSIMKTTTTSLPVKRRYNTNRKAKSKPKSSILVSKEDDLEDDEKESETVVEPRDTNPKDDDLEGETIVGSKDNEVEREPVVEPTDNECYTTISPRPHPDLKIEPFEISMISTYGVSINGSIVIPRDMNTILAMANAFKQAKENAFKNTKQEREFADNTAKMMYVSGETAEPSAETTGMVEEIVRQQVIEMVWNFDLTSISPLPTSK